MSHHECHHSGHSCSSQHHHNHGSESTCCECRCHQTCDCQCHKKHKYCDQLLELADDAWMEVLKEEIKKEIIKNSGDHLKKMAELVASANHKRWSEKMAEKRDFESFEEELKNLMSQKKK